MVHEPPSLGHVLPTWEDAMERDYRTWDRNRFVVDTAASDVSTAVHAIAGRLSTEARLQR
jgi:hypothetical protein